MGWRHQLPWCQLSRRWERAGLLPWASRKDSAYFRGSLTNGRHRRRLEALSRSEDGKRMLSVNHVTPVPIGTPSPFQASRTAAGCSLLACGSTIIHVQPPGAYDEFYLPRLRDHEHLVTVRRVADILPAMRLLRANESQRAVSPTTAAASL